jgi:hypothetical protein
LRHSASWPVFIIKGNDIAPVGYELSQTLFTSESSCHTFGASLDIRGSIHEHMIVWYPRHCYNASCLYYPFGQFRLPTKHTMASIVMKESPFPLSIKNTREGHGFGNGFGSITTSYASVRTHRHESPESQTPDLESSKCQPKIWPPYFSTFASLKPPMRPHAPSLMHP